MTVRTPVTQLSGVGPALAARLRQLDIRTFGDLIHHFPRRYEDWRQVTQIKDLCEGMTVVINASVRDLVLRPGFRRRPALARGELVDSTGRLSVIWFGQPWLGQSFVSEVKYLFRGEIRRDRSTGRLLMVSPAVATRQRLVPIYPETAGLTSARLRDFVARALIAVTRLADPLPSSLVKRERFLSYREALTEIHQPSSDERLAAAQERLAFGELYRFVRRLRLMRDERRSRLAIPLRRTVADLQVFVAQLRFQLTDDQRRAAWQIIQDIGQNHPMHRLLQGDVGSGKTVVAAFASYITALSGAQTIWLAPTDILARQHYQTLKTLLAPLRIPVLLRTAQEKIISPLPREVIVVGTHAVLTEKQLSHPIGLVVIDEQHRFGVRQREVLEKRMNTDGTYPHTLLMTATPIPRTYALMLYADMDLSILREKPAGRTPIQTRVIPESARDRVHTLIVREISAKRQVYVVCPLIDEDGEDDGGKKGVEAEYRRLTCALPEVRIGLLHGRLPAADKAKTMAAFAEHRLDLIVATSGIEVGVDVPNASIILIEGANRFGLAQLHQLRGRVGRGSAASHCLLIADQWSPAVAQRLRSLESTDDGFRLAELDLELRGPGELLGLMQSGLPDFQMASLFDMHLLARVNRALDNTNKSSDTEGI